MGSMMAYNEKVYEALEKIDANDDKAQQALKALLSAGKGINTEDELLENFKNAVHKNKDALGLSEMTEEDKGNIKKDGGFPFNADVKKLYNLALQKLMISQLPTLSRKSLTDYSDRTKINDGLKKDIDSPANETFISQDSVAQIHKVANKHLEERNNKVKEISDAIKKISSEINELQSEEIKKLGKKTIASKFLAIQKRIESQKTLLTEIKKLPYYQNDTRLTEKEKIADIQIRQFERYHKQKIEKTADKQQNEVQAIKAQFQDVQKQLEIIEKKKRGLRHDVSTLQISDEQVKQKLAELDNELRTIADQLGKLEQHAEDLGLQNNPDIKNASQSVQDTLDSFENDTDKNQMDKYLQTANMLMQVQGSLSSHFTDAVVGSKTAESSQDINPKPGNTVLNQENNSENKTKYKGIHLSKGQYIESKATFDPNRTARIRQDYNNRVSDHTDYNKNRLSSDEKSLVALKMAKMMMTNYYPKGGKIIISGTDPDMGHKVFASLLLLKKNSPELKGVKIESRVPGCEGPGIKDITNNRYIEKHIGGINPNEQKANKEDVQKTIKTRLVAIKDEKKGLKRLFKPKQYEKNQDKKIETDKEYDDKLNESDGQSNSPSNKH